MKQLPIALIPSKTFLFGEYAVLANAPAIVIATPPFFEINFGNNPSFNALSPAAKMLRQPQKLCLKNTTSKGLGKSSAECIVSWLQHAQKPEINQLLTEFYAANKTPASGADIKCQWYGYCTDTSANTSCSWPFPEIDIGIWATGEHVANHLAISEQTKIPEALINLANSCYQAWQTKNLQLLLTNLNAYQHCLIEQNLQIQSVQTMIQKIKENKHVLLAKGCGTMGADIILTLSNYSNRHIVQKSIAEIGLKQVFLGNYVVAGLKQQWQHCQHHLEYGSKNAERN